MPLVQNTNFPASDVPPLPSWGSRALPHFQEGESQEMGEWVMGLNLQDRITWTRFGQFHLSPVDLMMFSFFLSPHFFFSPINETVLSTPVSHRKM